MRSCTSITKRPFGRSLPTRIALGRRSRSSSGSLGQRGLTLIEILVVLLIVAGLMAMVIPSVQSVTGMRVRKEAGHLGGAISYLYNHAAVTGRTCRLVFSMGEEDGDAWTAECTEDPPRLDAETLQVRRGAVYRRDDDDDWFRRSGRDEDGFEERLKEQARWSQFASRTLQPTQLPSGIQIGGVWTPRVADLVSDGDANLYFFPTGETQRAIIYIVDSWDNAYTLDVQPLTGRVSIVSGWEEVPRD